MPYCSRCGVEVNELALKCPLCRAPIQKFYEDPAPGREFPADPLHSPGAPKMNTKERLRLASSMTTFGMLIPLLITLAVDITLNRRVTWSRYPLMGLTACWLLVLIPLFQHRNGAAIIWETFLVISGLLAALVYYGGTTGRLISLGIPIAFLGTLVTHIVFLASVRAARKGGNIAGYILIGIGIICLGTDLILSGGLTGSSHVSWSLIVLAGTQPVAGMLLYLHYRKKKRERLKKFFHI